MAATVPSASMDRSELERVFRSAMYSVETPLGVQQFRIGHHVEGLEGVSFAMVTGDNPGGVQRRPDENRGANERLQAALSRLDCVFTEGFSDDGHGQHQEQHFGVFGITREDALALAREFGQAAIVWFDGRTAELVWTDEAPPVRDS